MKKGLIASVTAHVLIIVVALFGLTSAKPFVVKPQDAVMVDISNLSDTSKKMATSTKADNPAPTAGAIPLDKVKPVTAPAPKIAPEENKAVNEPKPPPPPEEPKKEEPKKAAEPKPADPTEMTELLKKIEEKKKQVEELEKKQAEKKADPKPPKKPDKNYNMNVAEMEKLLNKTAGEHTAPPQPSKATGKPAKGETDTQGEDNANANTIAALLAKQIYACMQEPPAVTGSSIQVTIAFQLNQDGSLVSDPKVINPGYDPVVQSYENAAVSAIRNCQNYDLPKDKYEDWKDNEVIFQPHPAT